VAEHQADLDVHMKPFLLSSDVFPVKFTSQSNGKALLQPFPMFNTLKLCWQSSFQPSKKKIQTPQNKNLTV